jgi:hypothetical protein
MIESIPQVLRPALRGARRFTNLKYPLPHKLGLMNIEAIGGCYEREIQPDHGTLGLSDQHYRAGIRTLAGCMRNSAELIASPQTAAAASAATVNEPMEKLWRKYAQ